MLKLCIKRFNCFSSANWHLKIKLYLKQKHGVARNYESAYGSYCDFQVGELYYSFAAFVAAIARQ